MTKPPVHAPFTVEIYLCWGTQQDCSQLPLMFGNARFRIFAQSPQSVGSSAWKVYAAPMIKLAGAESRVNVWFKLKGLIMASICFNSWSTCCDHGCDYIVSICFNSWSTYALAFRIPCKYHPQNLPFSNWFFTNVHNKTKNITVLGPK